MWECDTCQTTLPTVDREHHLLGTEHWEREALQEILQRTQWEEIQAEKDVQACLDMEEHERWELEEMAKEVNRNDEMCKGKEKVGEEGVTEVERVHETLKAKEEVEHATKDGGEVAQIDETGTPKEKAADNESDVETAPEVFELSDTWEMDELAREVMRIDEMCHEEHNPSAVPAENQSDTSSDEWDMEEIARQVRQIDEICETRASQSSTNRDSPHDEFENPPGSSADGVASAETDWMRQLPYRPESSAQGARQDNIEGMHPHQHDGLLPSTAEQLPLTTPWYVPNCSFRPATNTRRFLPPVASLADLPPVLYRVYDNTSVSKYTWRGFAGGSAMPPLTAAAFKLSLKNHANWSSRQPTPYVSVTTSADSALWHIAKKQARGANTNIMVALIDTSALLGAGGARAWRMLDAMDHAGVVPRRGDRRVYVNEVICAGGIPAGVVFACCRPGYFREAAEAFLRELE